ncbi:MAG: Smr/MutS family protein [Kiloniellales bacterium]
MARKPGPEAGGEPGVTGEDLELWKHVTRQAKPLKKRGPPKPAPEAPEAPAPKAKPKPAKQKPARPQAVVKRPPPKPATPELEHGAVAGVDRRSATRMSRGQLPIEARLDLHGHRQDEAHRELAAFLAESQARSLRCVLVITGKGTATDGGGILRAQVPRWLNEPGNREKVLAFDYAQSKHGGHGAIYVLMRRRR